MDRQEALRKAWKLLRLASKGGTVGEAAAAAAQAQVIIEKYELSQAAIMEEEEPEEEFILFQSKPEGELDKNVTMPNWKWRLAEGIAHIHGSMVYYSYRMDKRSLEIVGRPSDVETVRYFYQWLKLEVNLILAAEGKGMSAKWKLEFCEGATEEIVKRLRGAHRNAVREVKEEFESNPYALIRINLALEKKDSTQARIFANEHLNLKDYTRRRSEKDYSAREAGAYHASKIDLNTNKKSIGNNTKQIGQ